MRSDGSMRKEYRLSSPVTDETLAILSKGEFLHTGYQYLSPTYEIVKSSGIEISGILHSPVITVDCPPGMVAGMEDYLIEFLSTIPDSEEPESVLGNFLCLIRSVFRRIYSRNQ